MLDYLLTDIRFFLPLSTGKTVWWESPDENLSHLLEEDGVRVQGGALADVADGEIDIFVLTEKSSVSGNLLRQKARPGACVYLSKDLYQRQGISGAAEHYWTFPSYEVPRFMIGAKDVAGFLFVADMMTTDKGVVGKCARILARFPFAFLLVQKISGSNVVLWRL